MVWRALPIYFAGPSAMAPARQRSMKCRSDSIKRLRLLVPDPIKIFAALAQSSREATTLLAPDYGPLSVEEVEVWWMQQMKQLPSTELQEQLMYCDGQLVTAYVPIALMRCRSGSIKHLR